MSFLVNKKKKIAITHFTIAIKLKNVTNENPNLQKKKNGFFLRLGFFFQNLEKVA